MTANVSNVMNIALIVTKMNVLNAMMRAIFKLNVVQPDPFVPYIMNIVLIAQSKNVSVVKIITTYMKTNAWRNAQKGSMLPLIKNAYLVQPFVKNVMRKDVSNVNLVLI